MYAERFYKTIRNLVKKVVFLKGNANWLSELPSVIKQYNDTVHNSTKMTSIQTEMNCIQISKIEDKNKNQNLN